ncbi:hypothetical protein Gohar_009983, partial [Gossypium harknessii]|nr:hypothetical protein [Gossypium harknessii]
PKLEAIRGTRIVEKTVWLKARNDKDSSIWKHNPIYHQGFGDHVRPGFETAQKAPFPQANSSILKGTKPSSHALYSPHLRWFPPRKGKNKGKKLLKSRALPLCKGTKRLPFLPLGAVTPLDFFI